MTLPTIADLRRESIETAISVNSVKFNVLLKILRSPHSLDFRGVLFSESPEGASSICVLELGKAVIISTQMQTQEVLFNFNKEDHTILDVIDMAKETKYLLFQQVYEIRGEKFMDSLNKAALDQFGISLLEAKEKSICIRCRAPVDVDSLLKPYKAEYECSALCACCQDGFYSNMVKGSSKNEDA